LDFGLKTAEQAIGYYRLSFEEQGAGQEVVATDH
jgi:hypothetical protein